MAQERTGTAENGKPFPYGRLTKTIIESFFEVYNELGPGFLESVYEVALARVLAERGVAVARQHQIDVYFRGEVIGRFAADLLVGDAVLVELKAVSAIHPEHLAQLMNYLRATQLEVGLLMNFGPTPSFKRVILTPSR